MPTIKKTLIITMHVDVSEYSDTMIEFYKAFVKAMASDEQHIEFEMRTENTEDTAERLLRLVRSEFKEYDAAPSTVLIADEDREERIVLSDEQLEKLRTFLASGKEDGASPGGKQ